MGTTVKMSRGANLAEEMGAFSIYEYGKDFSVSFEAAATEYFASKMNLKNRQVICDLSKSPIMTQSGAMQMMLGTVKAKSDIKGVGDLIGKHIRGKVTKQYKISI